MRQWLGVLAAGALLTACGGMSENGGNHSEPVTELHAGSQCGIDAAGPALHYLDDPVRLEQAFAATRAHLLGDDRAAVPDVDFERRAVLLLQMGQRPTGGYGLRLAQEVMAIEDGVGRLVVDWREPAADALVTQALTSPCLMVEVPAAEAAGYQTIRVYDQQGELRLEERL